MLSGKIEKESGKMKKFHISLICFGDDEDDDDDNDNNYDDIVHFFLSF